MHFNGTAERPAFEQRLASLYRTGKITKSRYVEEGFGGNPPVKMWLYYHEQHGHVGTYRDDGKCWIFGFGITQQNA